MEIYLPFLSSFLQAKISHTIHRRSTQHHRVNPCCEKIERHCPASAQPKPKIAAVRPPPSLRSLFVGFCNAMDDFIDKTLDVPLKPAFDPKHVLAGNFAPVYEIPPTECEEVEGLMPPCLVGGVYIRNGPNPNPNFLPSVGYHLFDGDGMIHALAFHKDGTRITLSSRYVRTHKHLEEEAVGRPVYPNIISGFHGYARMARVAVAAIRVGLGLIDPGKGVGVANTSVAFFHKRLLALGESGLPHALHITPDGDIHTSGAFDFGGKLIAHMTAHLKIDTCTGELFAFRYSILPPFLHFFRVTADGVKQPDVAISSMRKASIAHDFAVTRKYAVFPDGQLVLDPAHIFKGRNGSVVYFDRSKMSRIGVIPRYAADGSAMRWFDVLGLNFFHTLNAWDDEEENEIVHVAVHCSPAENFIETTDAVQFTVENIRINLNSGIVVRKPVSSRSLEFGVINQRFVGRRNRYAYMCMPTAGTCIPQMGGVVKLDFEAADGVVVCTTFGDGCFYGEPFFVPRNSGPQLAEDDGCLVVFVHNERTRISKFVLIDARSPALDIVASVNLPQRVPFGFHGLFVSAADLAAIQGV